MPLPPSHTAPRLITALTSAELQRAVAEACRKRNLERTWLAAPHRWSATQLLHAMLAAADSTAHLTVVAGIERGSLWQLAVRIATPSLVRHGLVPATHLGLEAGVFRALRNLQQPFSTLQDVLGSAGLPRLLASTIRELRETGSSDNAIRATGDDQEDLALILASYLESLQQAQIADSATIYQLAIKTLEQESKLPVERLLALDHPLRSVAQTEFVAALSRAGVDCIAAVLEQDKLTIDKYLRAWPDCQSVKYGGNSTDESSTQSAGTGLNQLRRSLFSVEHDGGPDKRDGTVTVLAAAGEEREALEMARQIQQRVEQGVPYDQIGIALRSPFAYQMVLEEAFVRAQIPAYFSRGVLRPDPAGRAFLALLSCKSEEYSASRFAEYLSLGQFPNSAPATADRQAVEAAPPWVPAQDEAVITSEAQLQLNLFPDDDHHLGSCSQRPLFDDRHQKTRFPRRWENLLVEASVIGGLERWQKRLDGLEQELRRKLEHVQSEEEARYRAIAASIDQVANLKTFALPLIQRLARLPTEADVGDWIPHLEGLAMTSLRHPNRVLALIADLRPMAGVGTVRFAELRGLLEQRLGTLRIEPEGTPYGRVYVGTCEDFRGFSLDTLLVPGMAEGIFPRRVQEDPLLLDSARQKLNPELVTNQQRIAAERLRLQIATAAARERLVISYPTWDGLTGRARVPSFYAFDTVSAAYGDIEALTQTTSISPVNDDPSLAIDEAEYDIATLQPLLRSNSAQEAGRANYLLANNRHLARSLRTRGRRWLNFLSTADGLVDPDVDTIAGLEAYRLRTRSYSPTALQHYAACPYRFYLQAILRLRPRDQAQALEQLDPLTRGSLYHTIQFRFLHTLQDRGSLNLRDHPDQELLADLDQAIEQVAAEYSDELQPALPAVFKGEVESIRTDLRGWLRQLINQPDFSPAYFELSFGLPQDQEHDPASSRDSARIVDGFLVKGSIDMVEIAADGVHRVTDHKTGKPRDTRSLVVGGGEALQPLIYAFAAEQLLQTDVGEGRLWYATRRGRFQSLSVPTGEYQRQSLDTVLQAIDQSITSGFFPAAPRQRACQYCDYRVVCGPHEELRIAIKNRTKSTRERLSELTHVRNME